MAAAKVRADAAKARADARNAELEARTRANMERFARAKVTQVLETEAQARARVALAEAKARYGDAFGSTRKAPSRALTVSF